MDAILSAPDCRVQAFLAAGHVCSVMGFEEYFSVAGKYHVPIVVTGFEPMDILQGILMTVQQLETGRAEVENQYSRAVRREGNIPAQDLLRIVYEIVPRQWRGLGEIPNSGLGLRAPYASFDAEKKFGTGGHHVAESPHCRSGMVLQGRLKPRECPAFGGICTPEHPLGATMVSSEGACAAYYRYRRV
jgi:hydrogenase expression/formation protein HypD